MCHWCESPGPGAIWGSAFDYYTKILWPRAHSRCCCLRIYVSSQKKSDVNVCLLLCVFIGILSNLAGKQQPIKTTAMCRHKPEPIYPGRLPKRMSVYMHSVQTWLWVRILCTCSAVVESNKPPWSGSHGSQAPEIFKPKQLIIFFSRRKKIAPTQLVWWVGWYVVT